MLGSSRGEDPSTDSACGYVHQICVGCIDSSSILFNNALFYVVVRTDQD